MGSRKTKMGEIVRHSTTRLASDDRRMIKRLKIKSPDTTKMHSVKYGKTVYFFKNKRKLEAFIRNEKHKELRNFDVGEENEDIPVAKLYNKINKKFRKLEL